jgi:hypothetical protein
LSAPWTLPAMAEADPTQAPLTSLPDFDAQDAHCDSGPVCASASPARVAYRERQLASCLAHPCVGYTVRSPVPGLEATRAGDAAQHAAPLELADRRATVTSFGGFGT